MVLLLLCFTGMWLSKLKDSSESSSSVLNFNQKKLWVIISIMQKLIWLDAKLCFWWNILFYFFYCKERKSRCNFFLFYSYWNISSYFKFQLDGSHPVWPPTNHFLYTWLCERVIKDTYVRTTNLHINLNENIPNIQ